jgi:hypothetical protein
MLRRSIAPRSRPLSRLQTHENKEVPLAVTPINRRPHAILVSGMASAIRHAASGRPQPKKSMLKYTETVGFAAKKEPQPTVTQVGYAKLASNAQFYLIAEPIPENAGRGDAGNAATPSHTPVAGLPLDSCLPHP